MTNESKARKALECFEQCGEFMINENFDGDACCDAYLFIKKLLEQVEQGGCKIDSKNYVDLCHEDLEHIENKYILIEREK